MPAHLHECKLHALGVLWHAQRLRLLPERRRHALLRLELALSQLSRALRGRTLAALGGQLNV